MVVNDLDVPSEGPPVSTELTELSDREAVGIHGLLGESDMLLFSRGFWITFQLISHKGLRYLLPLPLLLLLWMDRLLLPL